MTNLIGGTYPTADSVFGTLVRVYGRTVTAVSTASLRIELLGGLRVTVDGRAVPAEHWRRRKPAGVVKLLALAPGHRLHREQLMDALWPDLDPEAAAANLRKALHHARRALADDGSQLVSSGDLLLLGPDDLWIDVDGLRSAAARARRDRDVAAYEEAVDLYRDGLLPEDIYEDWASGPRAELEGEYVALLEELASLLEARGELDGAIRAARRLVSADPLREDAHVLLMRLYVLAGRRGDALRQYERLRDRLAAELGVEPGVDAQRLYEEVRTRQTPEPELTAELWERVGELRMVSGDAAGSEKAFNLALELDPEPGAVARLHRQAASACLMRFDGESAEPHLRAAESLAREPAERARLVGLRANQAWVGGDLDRAQALAVEARDSAAASGDADDLAAAQETLAIVSHMRGDWRQGLQLELERGGDRAALPSRVFEIHHCIGQYHLYGDGLSDGVEDYARRILTLAEQAGAVHGQAFAWCLLGESLLLHAHWEEAAGCLERSCELHASLGSRSGALAWQRLAELAVCRGTPDDADQYLRRASAIATVTPMAKHVWGRIYATYAFAQLELGDPEQAARSVRAASEAAARYGDCPTCSALLNPIAAEVASTLGDRDGAAAHAEAATAVAGMFDSAAWKAMAESAAASAATANGDLTRAREHSGLAAELYERAAQPYWRDRALAHAAAA
jgi:DNA-binding SARP family transcriptional activator